MGIWSQGFMVLRIWSQGCMATGHRGGGWVVPNSSPTSTINTNPSYTFTTLDHHIVLNTHRVVPHSDGVILPHGMKHLLIRCASSRSAGRDHNKIFSSSVNLTQSKINMLLKATIGRNHNQIFHSKRQSDAIKTEYVTQSDNQTKS
jgi:hypothetical protein